MQSRDLADASKTMVFIDRTMVLSVLKPSFWSVLERSGASWSVLERARIVLGRQWSVPE